jgi:hypothetical protein
MPCLLGNPSNENYEDSLPDFLLPILIALSFMSGTHEILQATKYISCVSFSNHQIYLWWSVCQFCTVCHIIQNFYSVRDHCSCILDHTKPHWKSTYSNSCTIHNHSCDKFTVRTTNVSHSNKLWTLHELPHTSLIFSPINIVWTLSSLHVLSFLLIQHFLVSQLYTALSKIRHRNHTKIWLRPREYHCKHYILL